MRTRIINLRTDEGRRALIDREADRRLFQLDEAAFRRFAKAVDARPAENPRLRKLLARRAPWER